MVDSYFVIDGSSSEFNLSENDKLWETNVKITEPEMFWIGVTIPTDNTVFELPVRGVGFDIDIDYVAYDWLIDYGDGSPLVSADGVGSEDGLIDGHNYSSAGYYKISVYPNANPDYGWARAFGCGYDDADNTKPFITNGGYFTYMSLAESVNNVGNYFNVLKYYDCINLTVPENTSKWIISGSQPIYFNYSKYTNCELLSIPEDTSNWSISGTQNAYFNTDKYAGCIELTIPEDTSNWFISDNQGDFFNVEKYFNCVKLSIPEDTSVWSISGSQSIGFCGAKYLGCELLSVPEDTSNWFISGSQNNNFNLHKYWNCISLQQSEDTSAWSISGDQGIGFCGNKYNNCIYLQTLEDWSNYNSLTATFASTPNHYLCYQMYYLDNPNTTLTGDTSVMRSKFPAAAQDNPPYPIATFHNRTGLLNYDTLGDNWK